MLQRLRATVERIGNPNFDAEFAAKEPGDATLQPILLLHRRAMNGGMGHALEIGRPGTVRAINAYRFWGARRLGCASRAKVRPIRKEP
jgi:hypothetical protein